MSDLSALEEAIIVQRTKVSTLAARVQNPGSWDSVTASAVVLMERHRHAGMVEAWQLVTGKVWPERGSWEADDA